MEKVASYIANRLVISELIHRDEARLYTYAIQVQVERCIAIACILLVSFFLKATLEMIAFLIVFMLLRRHSSGFHCETSVGCFLASFVISISTVFIVPLLKNTDFLCLGGVLLSMIMTCIIGAVNNPQVDFCREELSYHKYHSRKTVIILSCIVAFLLHFNVLGRLNGFLAIGIIYNGIILVMGKIKYGG